MTGTTEAPQTVQPGTAPVRIRLATSRAPENQAPAADDAVSVLAENPVPAHNDGVANDGKETSPKLRMIPCPGCGTKLFLPSDLPPLSTTPCTKCGTPVGRQAGVIAQQVEEVLPEAIREDVDGYLTVSPAALIGLLIAAVNELRAEVEALKNG